MTIPRWITGLIIGAIALGITFGLIMHRAPSENAATRTIRMGQPFELSLDQTATVESEALELMLTGIDDSRCPSDVQCPWAGQITTTIAVTKAGTPLGTVELTQQTGQEVAVRQMIDGYALELMTVSPYPQSDRPDPPNYQATFRLTESTSGLEL